MAGSKEYQKEVNVALVLRMLRENPGLSRGEVADRLKLDKSTMTHIVGHLMKKGILRESQRTAGPVGGRRALSLFIDESYGAVLGIEYQSRYWRSAVSSVSGRLLTVETGRNDTGNLDDLVSKVVMKYSRLYPLMGVGIGLPGIVDVRSGLIVDSPISSLSGVTSGIIEEKTGGYPVLIDNDANCAAWGWVSFRRGNGPRDFLYLILTPHLDSSGRPVDQEVGAGVVIGGRVRYGARGAAGELPDDLVESKLRRFRHRNGEPEEWMDGLLPDYLRSLFHILAPAVRLIDPAEVRLGGAFRDHRQTVVDAFAETSGAMSSPDNRWGCRVRFSPLGRYEVAYGAAAHWLEKLYRLPIVDVAEEPVPRWVRWND
jgi:predicted NBD/HSP70 family sugar kinase